MSVIYQNFLNSPQYSKYLQENPKLPIGEKLFNDAKCFCCVPSDWVECACAICQTMREYLHGYSEKHKKIRAANRAKPLLQQISCSCAQCGIAGRPGVALDGSLTGAMDALLSARTEHKDLMPGGRQPSKSGMSFRNSLSETGFEPNENFPDCKLVAAHYDEVDVEFREYEPMESSNKRWSKDELMPKKVSV